MDFNEALSRTLIWEGGYSDDPLDHGGSTNHGITISTLSGWRGHPVSKQEVRDLTLQEAGEIYRKNYWDCCRCSELPASVRGQVFDCAVNAGPGQAGTLLQRALLGLGHSLSVDGGIGPITIRAANASADSFPQPFTDQREAFYRRIVQRDPSQIRFLQGWLNRIRNW